MGIQITQNFSSQIQAINNAVSNAMRRVLYVDQTNGNDNNDGSQAAPFKTYKQAAKSIPYGGFARVIQVGAYVNMDESEDVNLIGKCIEINYSDPIEVGWTDYENGTARITTRFIIGNGGGVIFKGNYGSNAKIKINQNDTGLPLSVWKSLIHYNSNGMEGTAVFYFLNTKENYSPIEIYEGSLASGFDSSNLRGRKKLVIAEHYGRTGSDIVVNIAKNALLLDLYSDVGELVLRTNCKITDTSGNLLNPSDVIGGIVRDANGTPRNVISNLTL